MDQQLMRVPLHPLHLVIGLTAWVLWLFAIYGGLAIACTFAPGLAAARGPSWINGLIVAMALLVASVLLWQARACWRATSLPEASGVTGQFIGSVAAAAYLASAVASVALGLAALVFPPCL